jgi:predicted lipid carrier protein YhbT
VLRHQQLLGASKVVGDLRLVLPFKNRLDEAGAVVPVKQTCMVRCSPPFVKSFAGYLSCSLLFWLQLCRVS